MKKDKTKISRKDAFLEELNTINRQLESENMKIRVYLTLLFISLVIYTGFGIYPFSRVLMRKKDTITRLEHLNTSLEQKVNELDTITTQINSSKKYLDKLYKAMPKDADEEQYLVDTSSIFSTVGYTQNKFLLNTTGPNEVSFKHILLGSPYALPSLIDKMENSGRLIHVDNFSYYFKEGVANVNLDIKAYYASEDVRK